MGRTAAEAKATAALRRAVVDLLKGRLRRDVEAGFRRCRHARKDALARSNFARRALRIHLIDPQFGAAFQFSYLYPGILGREERHGSEQQRTNWLHTVSRLYPDSRMTTGASGSFDRERTQPLYGMAWSQSRRAPEAMVTHAL